MRKSSFGLTIFGLLFVAGIVFFVFFKGITPASNDVREAKREHVNNSFMETEGSMIELPEPQTSGGMALTEALLQRRSIRSYSNEPLSLAHLSQLLWSAQGITNERGFRTAPSAGATFPLEMFIVVNNVQSLAQGIYHYDPVQNTITKVHDEDVSADLARASFSQSMISDGSVVLVFGAVIERTAERYGDRATRYVHNEVGHASQNVHLQAAALDLGTVVIGAYRDEEVERILGLDSEIRVLYMMPVGHMP